MFFCKFACVAFMAFAAINEANAIDCYVCRGCQEVTSADIQTCSVVTVAPTEPPTTLEPTTDNDMNFDQPGDTVQVINAPYLIEKEDVGSKSNNYVLVEGELPGSSQFHSRSLMQYKAGDEPQCIIAVFEENGVTDVVRGCSYEAEDRCAAAVSDDFSGTFLYCNVCDDDLCNSATKSAALFIILVLSVFVNI